MKKPGESRLLHFKGYLITFTVIAVVPLFFAASVAIVLNVCGPTAYLRVFTLQVMEDRPVDDPTNVLSK